MESGKPHLAGFIVKEFADRPSNFRSEESLDAYLKRHGIVGLAGIDTRALVRRLRTRGAMKGVGIEGVADPLPPLLVLARGGITHGIEHLHIEVAMRDSGPPAS